MPHYKTQTKYLSKPLHHNHEELEAPQVQNGHQLCQPCLIASFILLEHILHCKHSSIWSSQAELSICIQLGCWCGWV